MMNKDGQQDGRFKPLEQEAFQTLEHSAVLKGLLKPFKGKSDLEFWSSQCMQMRDELIVLGEKQVLNQVRVYPFALLPIKIILHKGEHGMQYFRWRKTDNSTMGETLWDNFIENPATPSHLINDLLDMERQRLVFNMQVSLLNHMARLARKSSEKMSHAETVCAARTNSNI